MIIGSESSIIMIIRDYCLLIINNHDYWLLIINNPDYCLLIINTHDGTTERRPDGAPKGRNVDFTKESQRESRKSRTTARRPTARRLGGAGADRGDILCNSTWMRLEPLHCAKGTLCGEILLCLCFFLLVLGSKGDPWEVKSGMNGPPVAPHGPILSQDGGTPSKK